MRTDRALWLLACLWLLLASCTQSAETDQSAPADTSTIQVAPTTASTTPNPTTTSTTTVAEATSETTNLTLVYSQRDAFYTEGSATEFDLLSSSSGNVASGGVLLPEEGQEIAHLQLGSGTYTLRNWQRPCPGHCDGPLEPPTDICATRFTLDTETNVTAVVTIRPGQGCTIEVEGVDADPIQAGDYAALSLTFPVTD